MKTIDPHMCSCESLLDLTYAETFKNLDERFVRGIHKLVSAGQVGLCLGEYSDDTSVVMLATHPQLAPTQLWEPEVAFPIHLSSGQLISLLLDIEPTGTILNQIVQLIAVYVNQHGHLIRSNKDRLTGLKNRRSFDLEYRYLLESAEQGDSNVIAVLDIDHFKRVNDQFGHVIGDETLVAMANIMKQFFERDDYLYRFGGEEFIILLHDMDTLEAEIILEQLRLEIAGKLFPQIGKITVSMGYVRLTHQCDSVLLFERADAALYQAKKSGRNCIRNYRALVESGQIKAIDKRSGDVELF